MDRHWRRSRAQEAEVVGLVAAGLSLASAAALAGVSRGACYHAIREAELWLDENEGSFASARVLRWGMELRAAFGAAELATLIAVKKSRSPALFLRWFERVQEANERDLFVVEVRAWSRYEALDEGGDA